MNSSIRDVRAGLRQRLQPREFRIARPAWSPDLQERLAKSIEAAAQAIAQSARTATAASAPETKVPAPTAPAPGPEPDPARIALLADVGNGLWRMRRTMVPPNSGRLLDARPLVEMHKPFRWLISTWDQLHESGLEIQDHTGDRYISGQSLKAHFEAAPTLHEDTIVETIKPSLYFEGKNIQMGEVVVGTPDLTESPPPQLGSGGA